MILVDSVSIAFKLMILGGYYIKYSPCMHILSFEDIFQGKIYRNESQACQNESRACQNTIVKDAKSDSFPMVFL